MKLDSRLGLRISHTSSRVTHSSALFNTSSVITSRLPILPLLPGSDQEVIRRARKSFPEGPHRFHGPSTRRVVVEKLLVRVDLTVFCMIPTNYRVDGESRRQGSLHHSRLSPLPFCLRRARAGRRWWWSRSCRPGIDTRHRTRKPQLLASACSLDLLPHALVGGRQAG